MLWDKSREQYVINMLKEDAENIVKKTRQHYHFSKTYEFVTYDNKEQVILKRGNKSQPLIFKISIEDYYEKLLDAHVDTGHGGRDRVIYQIENKFIISKPACAIFVSLRKVCSRKKAKPKSGVVIKPILSDGFNVRGQVDLVDLQSCPDDDLKFLMNYQDHSTKFLHLRPLISKHARNVAEKLSKIFFIFGAPAILQSNNGREFVAAIIQELSLLWQNCKIVHGRPRHPQSQGSVKRANSDIKDMLRAWMVQNNTTNWSQDFFIVQVS